MTTQSPLLPGSWPSNETRFKAVIGHPKVLHEARDRVVGALACTGSRLPNHGNKYVVHEHLGIALRNGQKWAENVPKSVHEAELARYRTCRLNGCPG
jgi:hypothetical protein